VQVIDIGIPDSVLATIRPAVAENHPALWRADFPWPQADSHKYQRGHALVAGGGQMTGAGRLAARAALRVGAGLVTVACPPEVQLVYRLALAALLVVAVADEAAFAQLLADERRNAVLLGPGNGVSDALRQRVLAVLAAGRATVLDADALTACGADSEAVFRRLSPRCLLTPHEGEFRRLFPAEAESGADKLTRTRAAARRAGAVVLLKGGDTVIAAPDGHAVINANAPPTLATAGAGDVLAGLAVGLLAQGLDALTAAAIAVWLHGAAAAAVGPGLIADDLPEALPAVLARLQGRDASTHGRQGGA
jgi:NAD(P)H-hydrate epimerase